MSRYLLLFILNLPFILASILSVITLYKLGKISRKKVYAQLFIWTIILLGLVMAETMYDWLFTTGLTQTDSLSLFDVVQITAIVLLFYATNRMRTKIETIENRFQKLHQELSIRLSKDK